MTGRFLDDRLGKLHFWLILPGALLTFLPMYALGMLGMPRRYYTYAPNGAWDTLNMISSIGGFLIGVAILVFVVNLVRSLRHGERASDNPWNAWTLEWGDHIAAGRRPTSPCCRRSRVSRPLWDMQHAAVRTQPYPPDIDMSNPPAEVTVARLVATELEPEQASVLPLLAGVAVLIVAIGLLTSLLDRGGRRGLPDRCLGPLAWFPWSGPDVPFLSGERFSARGAGMLLFSRLRVHLLGVLIYTYLHLRIHLGVWPPPGMPRLGVALAAVNTVVLLTSGVAAGRALAAFRRGRMVACRLFILTTMVLGVGFLGGQAWEYTHVGFGLRSGLMGTTFFTLTGFHGAHVTAGLLLMAFMLVRSFRREKFGEVAPDKGTSGLMEAGTYYWHFVDAVWVVLFSVLYLL